MRRANLPSLIYAIFCLLLIAISIGGCTKSPEPTADVTQEAVQTRERPAATQRPQVAFEARATNTPWPTVTPMPSPTVEPTSLPIETPAVVPTKTANPTPAATVKPTAVTGGEISSPAILSTRALEVIADTSPRPPLSIEVSANRKLEGNLYVVSGFLRNDSDRAYAGLSVVVTFYTSEGRRYGPIRANVPCLLLTPGSACPFIAEATSRDLTQVMLHPEGYPTDRSAVEPAVFGLSQYVDAVGYVHVQGSVRNSLSAPVKHTTLVAALVDNRGEIVAVGARVLVDPIAANGTAQFELTMRYVPFNRYTMFVQAEP